MGSNTHSSCSRGDKDTVVSSIRALRRRETKYVTGDYLHQPALLSCEDPVDADCRSQMCQWCLQIVDHCKFNRETVAYAMNFLDRFLEVTSWALVDRSAFQLAAITSLYTAVKIHEPQAISIDTMAVLSRNVYSVEQIEAMERVMLQANQWLTHAPTSFMFAHYYCELISQADSRFQLETLMDLTKIQLESALQDYELSMIPPSSIAFAAVMNAAEGMRITTLQGLYEIEAFLASTVEAAESDCTLMHDIQIRLYEGILGSSTPMPPKAAAASCGSASSNMRPSSPRSVSTIRAVVPN